MQRITRLFIDTNALHQSWPRLSVKLENTLAAARTLGVAIEVPQPVLIELERNWRERTKGQVDSAKRLMKEIGLAMDNPTLEGLVPDWKDLQESHNTAVAKLMTDF